MLNLTTIGLIGLASGTIGKILIAYTAVMVHHRVRHEHKIDEEVYKAMRVETILAVIGIVLIIIEFVLEAYYKLNS